MPVPTYDDLVTENRQLRQQLADQAARLDQQQRTIDQLQRTVQDLRQRLAAADRAGKRQAAPFSNGPPKPDPKRPGRKPGARHGRHGHRPAPPPDQVDETLDAPLPDQCPDCHGPLVESHCDTQYQTEIPRRPLRRRFHIHCGYCPRCGTAVRGRHPLQTSAATGAARSQLGPDAQAAIVYLNKHAGVSYGKIAATFARLFGVPVTRGACAQVVLRAGERLRPVYDQIQAHLRHTPSLTPDETGWRIGGHPVWLHAWVGDDGTTCYAIDPKRSADALEAVIGRDWSGALTHDGFQSYDRFRAACHQQCVDHALRRARRLAETQTGRAKDFPEQIVALFRGALAVRDRYLDRTIDAAALAAAHDRAVQDLEALTDHPRTNAANETFRHHLYVYAEQWFQFLVDPQIPATNHRAEQALKTPIVNRKVWGGNRTAAGAVAQAVTGSVLQTCKNKALDVVTFVSNAFCGVLGALWETPPVVPSG